MILGIDEVGRGPWAGPLVVGAVVLPDFLNIDGLTDSKKLTANKRKLLVESIKAAALDWSLGWVYQEELDAIGLSEALRLATIRAVEKIKTPYHEIIIDGTINFLKDTSKGRFVTTLPKADLLIPSVSAAAILAKVARDEHMAKQAIIYPEYGFESHVGYGTARHRIAIEEYGLTPLHRRSFAPIAKYVQKMGKDVDIGRTSSVIEVIKTEKRKTTKSIGDNGELLACKYISGLGYTVLERNWKNRWCEIDIVAEKDGILYFIEVKTRKNSDHGSAVEFVGRKKLKQMEYAARNYETSQKGTLQDAFLAVVAIEGGEVVSLDVLEEGF